MKKFHLVGVVCISLCLVACGKDENADVTQFAGETTTVAQSEEVTNGYAESIKNGSAISEFDTNFDTNFSKYDGQRRTDMKYKSATEPVNMRSVTLDEP